MGPWASHGQTMGDCAKKRPKMAPEIAIYQHFSRADDGIRTRDPHLGKKGDQTPWSQERNSLLPASSCQ